MLKAKIKEYREKADLKQVELAELVSSRRETIVHLENGRYNPSPPCNTENTQMLICIACRNGDYFAIMKSPKARRYSLCLAKILYCRPLAFTVSFSGM